MSSRPVIAGFAALGLFWGAWASLLPSVQGATGASKSELGVALLCVAVGATAALFIPRLRRDAAGELVPELELEAAA